MRSYSSLSPRGQYMPLIPSRWSGSVEYLWDVQVQEWQGPKPRVILEPTNTLVITPPPAWAYLWAIVAVAQSQTNCPSAGCRDPLPHPAAKKDSLLLCGWMALSKLPLGP